MKKRRLTLFTAGILLGSAILSGCSSSKSATGPSGNSAGSGKSEKVVLELWWPISPDQPSSKPWFDAVDLYNKEHPNVQIHTQSIPYDQLHDKLIASATAGNLPDVSVALNEWITEFNKMGLLPDLTSSLSDWPDKDKISKAIWATDTIDGKIVGMPQYIGIRALEYHKSMLEKAGVQSPPKTWDELIETGKKLKDKGMIAFGLCGKSVRLPQELVVYFWQSGTDIAKQMPDGKYRNTWAEDPEELKKAASVFQFYKTMLDQGIISKDEVNWGYTEMDTNLAQGKVAMAVDGPWLQRYESSNPDTMKDLEIAPPIYSKQPATFLEVNSMITYKKSKHQKEAIEFMKWWGSQEAQQVAFKNNSVRSDVQDPTKWGKNFTDLVEQGRSWPHVSLGKILQSMTDSVQMVLLNQKSPEDTAKWLSDQVNNSLKENGELSTSK